MKTNVGKLGAWVLLAAMLSTLVGCVGPDGRAQTATNGALLGGAGALIGGLATGGWTGAAIGGGAGLAAGALGSEIQKEQVDARRRANPPAVPVNAAPPQGGAVSGSASSPQIVNGVELYPKGSVLPQAGDGHHWEDLGTHWVRVSNDEEYVQQGSSWVPRKKVTPPPATSPTAPK